MAKGEYTRTEIASQPHIWRETLGKMETHWDELSRRLGGLKERPFIVIGCGSTHYLAMHAASVLRSAGIRASAFPSSELVFFPQAHLPEDFVLLTVSRSGTTTETLWAMDNYRKQHPSGGKIITITCVPDTPMIQKADVTLLSEPAREDSVAQTRSFTSMVLMAQALVGMLAGERGRLESLKRLPDALSGLFETHQPAMETLGLDLSLERFFYLGNAAFYGLACEAMLKTKEMTVSWSEAYHTLEFRHGPMSVAAGSALAVGFISDSAAQAEVKVLADMKAKGARTLAFCETRGGLDWSGVDTVIELRSGLDEWQRPVLALPLIQWLAYYRAIAKRLDPDNPENLTQVVVLE